MPWKVVSTKGAWFLMLSPPQMSLKLRGSNYLLPNRRNHKKRVANSLSQRFSRRVSGLPVRGCIAVVGMSAVHCDRETGFDEFWTFDLAADLSRYGSLMAPLPNPSAADSVLGSRGSLGMEMGALSDIGDDQIG
jgi:hypothetical protein